MEAQERAVQSEQVLSKARNEFEDVKVELNTMADQFNKVKSMIETQKKFYMYSNEKLSLLIYNDQIQINQIEDEIKERQEDLDEAIEERKTAEQANKEFINKKKEIKQDLDAALDDLEKNKYASDKIINEDKKINKNIEKLRGEISNLDDPMQNNKLEKDKIARKVEDLKIEEEDLDEECNNEYEKYNKLELK